MKKLILTLLTLIVASAFSFANVTETSEEAAPNLEYVMELRVKCDPAFEVGNTVHGKRVIIPIIGGDFSGPNISGTVLPGGADYQMINETQGHTDLEAIYTIKTDDGVNIHIRNCGILVSGAGKEFYFRTAPKFEAPYESPYAWLNDAIFVCAPGFGDGYISLKVWKVK